jgi:Bacteriophage clamp loader A subunit
MSYELKDYLNSINFSKEYLMDDGDPQWEKKYPAFVVNKCMSGHIDTIMFANEMNMNHQLPSKLQYDFLLNSVRKRKRFSPWIKKEKIQDLDAVKSYYGYSNEKAQQALKILTKDQINYIKSKLDVGGKR